MKRIINKVAVIGSGIMGSGIACHFANIGIEVLLLDLPNLNPVPDSFEVGSKDYHLFRNKMVNDNLSKSIKSNPSPLYTKTFASRIATGNLEDDLPKIESCDWIIEVIVEKLEIKNELFEKIEQYRKPGTIISSNTSGIPIQFLAKNRSDDFKKHFCGTHFFNPPRYLKLLEIIPTPYTNPELISFLEDFGKRFLGKTTVVCNDTPAFIANRIGVFSILVAFTLAEKKNFTFSEIDKLTGTVIGRAKSATFRTVDVVGLDTLIHVINDLKANCKNDELLQKLEVPNYINKMFEQKLWGSKTKAGFYKKEKKEGKSTIYSINPETMEFEESKKPKIPELQMVANLSDGLEKLMGLIKIKGRIADFYKDLFFPVFSYASLAIPYISSTLQKLDEAMKAGFGWKSGVFETWEALGLEKTVSKMKEAGYEVAPWIDEMLASGASTFYKVKNGQKCFYLPDKKTFSEPDTNNSLIVLENIRAEKTIWKNSGSTITDLGDGVLNLEFHTKMNVIGGEVIEGINKAITLAENEHKALVIYNTGDHFSAGANVGIIFMLAREQEFEELDMVVRQFQQTMMRVRYSSIPVVAAVHGFVFGGGCELAMHADKVIAHAETYMGLVEMGVGLIPAGGGTKEFALRLSDEMKKEDVRSNAFRERFLTIGQAAVSTSAYEAFEKGYLRKGIDEVIVSRDHQLLQAKKTALQMADKGYVKPIKRNDIYVLGKEGYGLVLSGANNMKQGGYITEYEEVIAQKLGTILCGGELSGPSKVSEDYLLNLERKSFVELCMQRKTLERLQSFITTGKMIRN